MICTFGWVSPRVRRSYSFSFETGPNVSVSHFASNRKKNLIKFIKLNLFVFVRDGGNVIASHFASYRKKI
jgi:hypothetical protein